MLLCVACAVAAGGGIALLLARGGRILEGARLASANAAPTSIMPASEWNDLEFLLCHTPAKAVGAVGRSVIRVAAAQTEAPQAKTNAASPALAFVFACGASRSEEHTSELQSHLNLVSPLLLNKKKKRNIHIKIA